MFCIFRTLHGYNDRPKYLSFNIWSAGMVSAFACINTGSASELEAVLQRLVNVIIIAVPLTFTVGAFIFIAWHLSIYLPFGFVS